MVYSHLRFTGCELMCFSPGDHRKQVHNPPRNFSVHTKLDQIASVNAPPLDSTTHYYHPQRSWGKVIFSEACVNNSVHRHNSILGFMVGCVWLHRGHAWFYLGGMHGFIWGACMVLFGGHAWFYSGGMHSFIWGVCMVLFGGMHGFIQGGMHGFFSFQFGYNVVRSMSGRYASYWNAFLFSK